MITNIIKNLIKDIPSVANSSIRLMNENRNDGQTTFVTTDASAVAIVLTNVPKGAPKSISAYKKQMIADFLYLVAVEGRPYAYLRRKGVHSCRYGKRD